MVALAATRTRPPSRSRVSARSSRSSRSLPCSPPACTAFAEVLEEDRDEHRAESHPQHRQRLLLARRSGSLRCVVVQGSLPGPRSTETGCRVRSAQAARIPGQLRGVAGTCRWKLLQRGARSERRGRDRHRRRLDHAPAADAVLACRARIRRPVRPHGDGAESGGRCDRLVARWGDDRGRGPGLRRSGCRNAGRSRGREAAREPPASRLRGARSRIHGDAGCAPVRPPHRPHSTVPGRRVRGGRAGGGARDQRRAGSVAEGDPRRSDLRPQPGGRHLPDPPDRLRAAPQHRRPRVLGLSPSAQPDLARCRVGRRPVVDRRVRRPAGVRPRRVAGHRASLGPAPGQPVLRRRARGTQRPPVAGRNRRAPGLADLEARAGAGHAPRGRVGPATGLQGLHLLRLFGAEATGRAGRGSAAARIRGALHRRGWRGRGGARHPPAGQPEPERLASGARWRPGRGSAEGRTPLLDPLRRRCRGKLGRHRERPGPQPRSRHRLRRSARERAGPLHRAGHARGKRALRRIHPGSAARPQRNRRPARLALAGVLLPGRAARRVGRERLRAPSRGIQLRFC